MFRGLSLDLEKKKKQENNTGKKGENLEFIQTACFHVLCLGTKCINIFKIVFVTLYCIWCFFMTRN